MESGLEAISLIADHAAVGAVLGAAAAFATQRRSDLDLWLAYGMVAGAAYGFLVAIWRVS